jgi:hypothetical protein
MWAVPAVTPGRPEALYPVDGPQRTREPFPIPLSWAGRIRIAATWHAPRWQRCQRSRSPPPPRRHAELHSRMAEPASGIMTEDGQPPMVDDQAIIVFLRQLDHALSDALGGDEQRRLRWLTVIHALVMAVLADPRQLDQALRQAADGLAQLNP